MNRMIHLIEEWLTFALEFVRRTIYRLDPRLYSERLRIRTVTEGMALKESNKFAVFVVYSHAALPEFTMNFITALNRHSYNVVIVSNAELDTTTKGDLLRNCRLLVERVNFGRDFGAYKDGINIAVRRFQNIERLIIANDSVYYLNNGLDRLIADLDGPEDFIGVSEAFAYRYHAASFLLSFGAGVLKDPVFHRFWAGYLPIPSRMWVILEGEIGLTTRLVEAGHRPHILFKAEHLLPKLLDLEAAEMNEAILLFPTEVRALLTPVIERISGAGAEVNDVAQAAIRAVLQRNQMHAAGFAFMKFLGLPLFKRDIVYRELFPIQEIDPIVTGFGEPMQAAIVKDLARRPPPPRSAVVRRLLFRHGYI
jgi:hypothetical protein